MPTRLLCILCFLFFSFYIFETILCHCFTFFFSPFKFNVIRESRFQVSQEKGIQKSNILSVFFDLNVSRVAARCWGAPLQADSGAAPAPFLRSFQRQVCLFTYLLCPTRAVISRPCRSLASNRMDRTNWNLRRGGGGGDQGGANHSLGRARFGEISEFSDLYETL